MDDAYLIEFAKKEKDDLTAAAIEALRLEIQQRGLDGSFLKRSYTDSPQQNSFSYWQLAFDARKSGMNKEETIHELIKEGLPSFKVRSILETIPNFDYQNKEFDELILKRCGNSSAQALIILLLVFGASGFFIFAGTTTFLNILVGIVLFVFGCYMYSTFKGDYKGAAFWLELIKTNQDQIVWIKPITEKHTIGFVLTLFSVKKFQFLTRDNMKVTMVCDTLEEQKMFFEGIKNYLPHVHFGYTIDALNIYEQSPHDFIEELRSRGLYTPIAKFEI